MGVPKERVDMKVLAECLKRERRRVMIRKQPYWRHSTVVVLAGIRSSHIQAFDGLGVALW